MTDQLQVEARDGAVRFPVRVSPRASRDAVGGVHDGALRVRVTAPPVDGAANAAIQRLIARRLGVAKGSVRIVAGETSKTKTIEVDGVSPDAVRALA